MFWKSSSTHLLPPCSGLNDLSWWLVPFGTSVKTNKKKTRTHEDCTVKIKETFIYFWRKTILFVLLLHIGSVNLQTCNPVSDSSVLWLISLMPGLSLVILRQITQDYDLMGSVKSAGRHQGPLSKESLQNAAHTSQIIKC